MNSNKNPTSAIKVILLCSLLLLNGCGITESESSTDIAELQELVKIPIPMEAVQWEKFCWPCDDTFLPNNPTFYILIAEFKPSSPDWFSKEKEPIKDANIVPGTGRDWMSSTFKTMLATKSIDINKFNCSGYKANVTRSGRPVDGFVCESTGRGFLYLVLLDNSLKPKNNYSSPVVIAETDKKQIGSTLSLTIPCTPTTT